MNIDRRAFLVGAGAATAGTDASWAQSWPTRAVTLVNPFAAGGQSDAIGRLVAAHLQTALGQPVTIENRTGAGGTLGAQAVAKAEPDGHTILFGTTSTYTVAPAVYQKPGYDPRTALAPITVATEGAMVLCAHPARGFATLAEALAAARAKPRGLTVASAGNGSLPHVLAEAFATEAGVELVHVPYRGGAPAMNDLVAGHVDLMFEQIANVVGNVEAGRVVPLFQTGAASALLPRTPTAAEVDLPGLALTSWTGFAAPRGTPQPVIDRLAAEIRAALTAEGARQIAAKLGLAVVADGPAPMAERIAREFAAYRRVAQMSRISIEP